MKTNNRIQAVLNFIYYTANFNKPIDQTINEVWKDNPHLAVHFNDKWNSIIHKPKYVNLGFVSSQMIIEFIFMLSDSNKKMFIEWIDKNYFFD